MSTFRWIADHLEELLGASLLAVMACLAFANVITRYVFQYPLAFTEELEVNALVWLTMFGTSSAFRRRKHLSMLFFQDKLSAKTRYLIQIGIVVLSVGLFVSLGFLAYLQLMDERFLEITSESLGLPQWLYTVGIPIGCVMVVFRILQAAVIDLRRRA
ncbi:MAG: TRAP transporter small permease [Desulfobulbaceae bacterium]|nr:TRAP transporter small permease [Desulfobulbaceae bacterium]